MARARRHENCSGILVRVYERPVRSGPVTAIGYLCKICRTFVPDGGVVTNNTDLRPAIDVVVTELTSLLWDRQVNDRFAGIVRANPDLLAAAQKGNPLLGGVRRWWATSTALILRRHVDGAGPQTLRSVVEALSALGEESGRAPFVEDLRQLEAISDRFRPYFNILIHGAVAGAPNSTLTFDELSEAIDTVRDVAQRAYVAIANVSRRLDPVAQFEWTDIFEYPWIDSHEEMAYTLGEQGVPYDAVPMTMADALAQARLEARVGHGDDGSIAFTVSAAGKLDALDVRIFLPYAGTIIDEEVIPSGSSVTRTMPAMLSAPIYGQAVFEFEDQHGRVYRQYADVSFESSRIRKLDRLPYRVSGRIVAPSSVGAA